MNGSEGRVSKVRMTECHITYSTARGAFSKHRSSVVPSLLNFQRKRPTLPPDS